ncbi:MAG TPA: TMEM175 family protein [Usitatibacteraceae bacterium]|nr:TMEM175 family protein [Usitatibacteraceae bacterium]
MSKHRTDALTDGIFAVAMTLLVIELKVPEALHVKTNAELIEALVHLLPKFIGWLVSFFVLAMFWWGHHRAFNGVRHVDGKLVALNLAFLGFVSFMPFASALTGEYGRALASQMVYAGTMLCVAIFAQLIWRYIHRHPELCAQPMSAPELAGARARTFMLMALCVVSILVALLLPGAGNMAFMFMGFAGAVGRKAEARASAKSNSSTLSV